MKLALLATTNFIQIYLFLQVIFRTSEGQFEYKDRLQLELMFFFYMVVRGGRIEWFPYFIDKPTPNQPQLLSEIFHFCFGHCHCENRATLGEIGR